MQIWHPHLKGPFPRAGTLAQKKGIGVNTNIYESKYNK
jgi:hypothetical protein